MNRNIYFFLFTGSCALFSFCGNNEAKTTVAHIAAVPVVGDDKFEPTGSIAYYRDGAQIRLIDSNGNNDRQIWTHADARDPLGLFDLAWRPDGKELVFSSAHESVASIFHADLYGIRPDGSGYRKITNTPDFESLKKFKKGTVIITVKNEQYTFMEADASVGVFILNIVGAEKPIPITLPPGSSKTFTFRNVADLGDNVQPIVVINGSNRWYMPGTDVVAGKTIKAPDMIVSGNGYPYFGAFRPVWKSDGSLLSYRDGLCQVKYSPVYPKEGEFYYEPVFGKEQPAGTCTWDFGPTPGLVNKIVYTENEGEQGSGIYVMDAGSKHNPGSLLVLFSESRYQIAHDLRWKPDGTGVIYSATNWSMDASNIFMFDIRTKQTKQITNLQNEFARRFTISPSGKWIVYERCKTIEDYETVDLWIISTDGMSHKLLVQNGLGPAWSR